MYLVMSHVGFHLVIAIAHKSQESFISVSSLAALTPTTKLTLAATRVEDEASISGASVPPSHPPPVVEPKASESEESRVAALRKQIVDLRGRLDTICEENARLKAIVGTFRRQSGAFIKAARAILN